MEKAVLVLGSTGSVGGRVAEMLQATGVEVRSATRDPEGALRRGGPGPWVRFDLERPETFDRALARVDRVFMIARPGDDRPEALAMPLIDRMVRGGVRHVVNLTALGTERREEFGLRKVERYLEASGLGFTHLRPNWFMQVFSTGSLLQQLRAGGVLRLPLADARISYVDVDDIAAVAVAALTRPGHAGRACDLTGPEALDHHAVVRFLSAAAGREFRYEPIDEETARTALLAAAFPPVRVERLLAFYGLARAGLCEPVSHDVERLTGRPAGTFERFAARCVSCWAPLPP